MGRQLRVVLFASGGEIPLLSLRAIVPICEVVGIVRPARPAGAGATIRRIARRVLRGPPPPDEFARVAREIGIPGRGMRGATDAGVAPWIRALRADMVCVATFPWRLRDDVLASAPVVVNLHASLLPRHRGPNPWFWIYHANDLEAGATVHLCAPAIDSGEILARAAWPLVRGYPVQSLHRDVAMQGAGLLAEVVASAGRQALRPRAQDHLAATRAPRLTDRLPMVDPGWGAERTWHFLAGTAGQYLEPLNCAGSPVPYTAVPGFELTGPGAPVGIVEATGARTWRLWCNDGWVTLHSR